MVEKRLTKIRRKLKQTPEPSDFNAPMASAIIKYKDAVTRDLPSSWKTDNIQSSAYKKSFVERQILNTEKIIPSVFKTEGNALFKLFFTFKLLGRARTYEERRIAGLRFLGRKSFDEIATHFTASDRQAIAESELKHPSGRTMQRTLSNFLKSVDLRDDIGFYAPKTLKECLELVPTKEELDDFDRYYRKLSESTLALGAGTLERYYQENASVPKSFIKESFEAETIFLLMFRVDMYFFSFSLHCAYDYAKDFFSTFGLFSDEKIKTVKRVLDMKYLEKKSIYEITVLECFSSTKSVERIINKALPVLDHHLEDFQIVYDTLARSIDEKSLSWYKHKCEDKYKDIFAEYVDSYNNQKQDLFIDRLLYPIDLII